MKRKISIIFLALLFAFSLSFGIACKTGEGDNKPPADSNVGGQTPPTPANPSTPSNPSGPSNPSQGGENPGDNQEQPVPGHEHTYSKTWTYDGEEHWRTSTCGHDVISDRDVHLYSGNTCTVCGYVKPEHTHTFSSVWTFDEKEHWHAADCGHDIVPDKIDHLLGDKGCLICDYRFPSKELSYYEITENGQVTGYGVDGIGSATDNDIVIPAEYNGKPVTEIASGAFFYCGFTTLTVPDSIVRVGSGAFEGCNNLRYNDYAGGVYLGNAFNPYLIFVKANNPSSATYKVHDFSRIIYDRAFKDCSNLQELDLSGRITYIGEYAFRGCGSLDNVVLPSSLKEIGEGAFDGCVSLSSIVIPDSVTKIGKGAFGNCGSLERATLSKNLTRIEDEMFLYCSQLAEIVVPEGVTYIGTMAFGYCQALDKVTLPDSLVSLGENVFGGCGNITYNQYDNAIYLGNDSNPYIVLMKVVDLSIDECEINEDTKIIYGSAFANCVLLKSISLPEGLLSIGNSAFYSTGLKSIFLPSSLIEIKDQAFYNCFFTQFNEDEDARYIGSENNPYLILYEIKDKSAETFTVREGVRFIYEQAFKDAENLYEVVLPQSLQEIRDGAFENCSELTDINLPESLTYIGGNAFYGCSSLSNVILPESLTYIGGNAFYGCAIQNIIIPDSVTYAGAGAFKNCTNLKTVKMSAGMTDLSEEMFSGCTSLLQVNIPYGIKYISGQAFDSCTSLESLDIPESVIDIANFAFSGCSSLKSLKIPVRVENIGVDAFKGCDSLREFVFDGTVRQWTDLKDSYCWNYFKGVKITCSDGDITIRNDN